MGEGMKPADYWAAHRATYERIKAVLRAAHPDLFDGDHPKPLRIGIKTDIRKAHPQLPRNAVNVFLKFWTRRREYHAALVASEVRYDLAGNTYGISPQHRERAERWAKPLPVLPEGRAASITPSADDAPVSP